MYSTCHGSKYVLSASINRASKKLEIGPAWGSGIS